MFACWDLKGIILTIVLLAGSAAPARAEAQSRTVAIEPLSSAYILYYAAPGEVFLTVIDGDRDTDLDLIVRNPAGLVACKSAGPSDYESCLVRADGTGGPYSIEIRNLGRQWTRAHVDFG